jgi:hypothetical protein
MTILRYLLARWLGAESAYGHLAAASVNAAIEETSRVS